MLFSSWLNASFSKQCCIISISGLLVNFVLPAGVLDFNYWRIVVILSSLPITVIMVLFRSISAYIY